jgi:3-oxoacyl-[acyl-carrier protein] reductase
MARLSQENHRMIATWFSARPEGGCARGTGDVTLRRLDVTDSAAVENLVAGVEKETEGIDILINNAGAFLGGKLQDTSDAEMDRVLDVNLAGVFRVCKAVLPYMTQRNRGQIINVASAKGIAGAPGASAYAASKAGVIALTRSLAREVALNRVAVNAVCPGFISSKLNHFDPALRSKEKRLALLDIEHNLSDLVNFVSFLCGDNFQSVTGQVFQIDSRICESN